jgi:hypothetical protein
MEKHPLQEESRQLLTNLLKQDHGGNWSAWETEVKRWIQERPE